MLQNEYLVAKIGVDTAENGPSEIGELWTEAVPFSVRSNPRIAEEPQQSAEPSGSGSVQPYVATNSIRHLDELYSSIFRQLDTRFSISNFERSFSSVSKPIFATKYEY